MSHELVTFPSTTMISMQTLLKGAKSHKNVFCFEIPRAEKGASEKFCFSFRGKLRKLLQSCDAFLV